MPKYVVIFYYMCLLLTSKADKVRSFGMIEKIKSGFKLAGKLLGFDHAKEVAKLVNDAFGKNQQKGDTSDATYNNNNNIFSGFLRILGLDARKISAIAVNAIIFVAQLISSSLSRPVPTQLDQAKSLSSGTPLDWLKKNSEVDNLIEFAKDEKLPQKLIQYIKERSMDEETDCVQLLVCKSSPFIWGMQKALSHFENQTSNVGRSILFKYLPPLREIEDNGDKCEEQHPYCLLNL